MSNSTLALPWLGRYPRIDRVFRRYEKRIPIVTFAAGFLWDALTLTRIDRLSDNLILLGYLVALAGLIVVTLRRQAGSVQVRWLAKLEPHLQWSIQFLIGGLLSSYVVYYFKSSSWTQSEFFLLMLVLLLVGNEFLHHRLGNPQLLAALFMFCLFSFLAFFLPILLASVADWIFVVAGVLSLLVSVWVFALATPKNGPEAGKSRRLVNLCLLSTYLALNICYFANLIPPVPLSLKQAGIYHHVRRTAAGYEVKFVPPPRYRFWEDWDDPFYTSAGESAYCYTAVFAPRGIHVPVRHIWSHRGARGWEVTDRIGFEISGGRDGGYRGYSQKKALAPGAWRVEVETYSGKILGRIDFKVSAASDPPPLQSKLIQ